MSKVVVWASKSSNSPTDKEVIKPKVLDINLETITSNSSSSIWWENNRLVINNDISTIDIIEIHIVIREKLKTITNLETRLSRLTKTAAEIKFIIEKNNILQQCQSISNEIAKLEDLKDKYDSYCPIAKSILLKFKNLSPDKTIIFGKGDIRYNDEKIQVIRDYLSLLKTLVDFDIILQPKPDNVCLKCNAVICPLPVSAGIITCIACGTDKIVYNSSEISKSRYTDNSYEDISNFSKALLRFQGKQRPKFGQELYNKLDTYFSRIKRPTSEVVKTIPLTSNGKKEGTSYSMLYTSLFETGNAGHYEDANLIAHYYWGWKLPEISAGMEKVILEQYSITQKIFRNMPIDVRGRKSSLNTQYRLYKHLQLVGYPCTISDFKIPDTNDVVEGYDETWEKMCQECNLQFIPTK